MKIFIDENLPPRLSHGIQYLEEPNARGVEVLSIKEVFGKEGSPAQDEDWIPQVGAQEGVVITQDFNIHRLKSQYDLYRDNRVGLFIIRPPKKIGYSYWQFVQIIVKEWNDIIEQSKSNTKPFLSIHEYTTPSKGFKLQK
jgi:hypothetical protein